MKSFYSIVIVLVAIISATPASSLAQCVAPPSGMVAWWQAEGNANDSAGLNAGMLSGGVTYVGGEAGQAFGFNGSNAYVFVSGASSLDVGNAGGLTLEAWINPADATQAQPLLQWNTDGYPYYGVSWWISVGTTNGGTGPGCVLLDLKGITLKHRVVCSPPGLISSGIWQHVAGTYDKTSGIAALYVNGSLAWQTNIGSVTPATTENILIGHEEDQFSSDLFASIQARQSFYAGVMDELAIYNRALSGTEIASIFGAGMAGKCAMAPSVASIEPASQSIAQGEACAFSVTASGSPLLSYQWTLNGTNLSGATGTTLSLSNVKLSDAGTYSVVVSNPEGSNSTATAVLTVMPTYAPTWALATAPTNTDWSGVASSADGQKLVACSYDGQIYTSPDAGATWVSNNAPQLTWMHVASSADGTRLAASATTLATIGAPPGGIYISTNSGATWKLSLGGNAAVLSSKDGLKLSAGNNLSSDGGITWTPFNSPEFAEACSGDGSRLLGTDNYSHLLYTSSNRGTNWTLTTAPNTNRWQAFASSADGGHLYAGAIYGTAVDSTNGLVFSSSDYGVHWAPTGSSMQRWNTIACSDDGMKLVAGVNDGYLYVSSDAGTNWVTTRAPSANWASVATSADGTQLVACQWPGGIYTWRPTALNMSIWGGNIVISWPTNVPGFILQERPDLSSANWSNVTNQPVVTNCWYQVTLPMDSGNQMFRLVYP